MEPVPWATLWPPNAVATPEGSQQGGVGQAPLGANPGRGSGMIPGGNS